MLTILATALAIAIAMLAMGVGFMAGRRPLAGSCGRAVGECACGARGLRSCDVRTGAHERLEAP